MDFILRSHVIEPLALRCDDFEEFFKDRQRALVERIEAVMGKKLFVVESDGDMDDFEIGEEDGENSEAAA